MDISKGQSVSNGNNVPFDVSVVQGVAVAEAADRREQLLELRGLRDERLITESVYEKKQQEVLALSTFQTHPTQALRGVIPVVLGTVWKLWAIALSPSLINWHTQWCFLRESRC
jgi:hypothetical protein